MRRATLALGCLLTCVGLSFSQDKKPDQDEGPDTPLKLVRKLRAAGLIDLAVMRLEELKTKPGLLDKEDQALVPFELAKIRLEEASRETDDSRRAGLIGQARTSFRDFIAADPKNPMAAEAQVELAHLSSLQAKSQLSKANRIENNKELKALEFSRARPDFTNAINLYQGAVTNIDNRLKGLAGDDKSKKLALRLEEAKQQAELDTAVLRIELARTYDAEEERGPRGEGIDKAQKEFDKLAEKYAGTRIGFLASVWSWQCAFYNGDDKKSVPAIEKFIVTSRGNPKATDAVRLASYFGIEHALTDDAKDTTPVAKYVRTEQAAVRWLQTYPESKNTPEGLGARYRRALMKEFQALKGGGITVETPPKPKTPPKGKEPEKEAPPTRLKITGISPAAKQLLEDANKLYKELTDTDNEVSDRAHRHRLSNQLVILEAEGKGGDPPLKAINALEQGYLAAQVQQARIYDLGKDPSKTEEQKDAEEKKRIEAAVNYLERGLQRVTPKDTPREVFDAQMLLVQFLTKKDRAIEAAVLGEGLARNNPKMPKASVAAALAVFAYNSALAKLKESTNKSDEAEASDMNHLVSLAEYTDKTWPNDSATDAVRHVLAFYQGKKDYETAWKTYGRISAGYSEVYQARREMAGAMFYLLRPEERDPKKYRDALTANIEKRAKELKATLDALEALPDPPASAPANTIDSWAGARTMQAQLYYMKSDYDKVDAVVKLVLDTLKKFPTDKGGIDPKKRDDLAFTIRVLKYNSLQGRAAEFIKAKEFAKIGEGLGPDLEALKKEMKDPAPMEPPPGFDRMRGAQRGFLIACMSAFVQNKEADKASELLDALQASGGSLEASLATMKQLNSTIQNELNTLTKDGKKADADDLAKSYADFLDKIKGEDTSKLANGVILFLGQGYGAVGQPAKSAELFAQLMAQKFEPDPKKNQQENDDAAAKHAGFVKQLEFLQARAYRQAGVAEKEAAATGAGKAQFDKATALMKNIVGDPLKKGPQGWGYKNTEIRKEYIALLEDQDLFGPAVNNWVRLTNEYVQGGLPLPIKFLGARVMVTQFAETADLIALQSTGIKGALGMAVDHAFKAVIPPIAQKRDQARKLYFDLFFEAQRCSARAYTTPSVVAKVKGGQETANQKLSDIGQKLSDMMTKNDDVPPEVREKLQDFLNLDRYKVVKKKYDELMAAAPKATP